MLEQQRIEYLQAMGIQLWMPRQALDNAAEPSWLADSASDNAQSEAVGSGAQVQAGHAADLLADMGLGSAVAKSEPIVKEKAVENISATAKQKIATQNVSSPPVENTAAAVEDVTAIVDLTVPNFELHFALWPCGILWVAGKAFDRTDNSFQTSVSYSLLGNAAPQASYSQFKWPYIEGSSEDQSMAVALRALTAQWEFMSGQGARGWVAMDGSSYEWLSKVALKPLFSVDDRDDLYCSTGKRQLWLALQNLPSMTVS
ncbi:hypothetical protein A9R00_02070 [Oleispira antarctica]|uniref:Uncharacterized protein n=1 Tax=Oleispira antarctica TaxID=188908 RepID=A0A1Y5HVU4_OLEAN|nr:hypothetical protein A9R00_02070 [Oleispira antarctica]